MNKRGEKDKDEAGGESPPHTQEPAGNCCGNDRQRINDPTQVLMPKRVEKTVHHHQHDDEKKPCRALPAGKSLRGLIGLRAFFSLFCRHASGAMLLSTPW